MPFYKGIEIFVADAKTEIIKGATDSGWIGKTLETLGITSAKTKGEKTGLFYAKFDGNLCRYSLCQDDNYIVVVTVENTFLSAEYCFCDTDRRCVSYTGILLHDLSALKGYERKI